MEKYNVSICKLSFHTIEFRSPNIVPSNSFPSKKLTVQDRCLRIAIPIGVHHTTEILNQTSCSKKAQSGNASTSLSPELRKATHLSSYQTSAHNQRIGSINSSLVKAISRLTHGHLTSKNERDIQERLNSISGSLLFGSQQAAYQPVSDKVYTESPKDSGRRAEAWSSDIRPIAALPIGDAPNIILQAGPDVDPIKNPSIINSTFVTTSALVVQPTHSVTAAIENITSKESQHSRQIRDEIAKRQIKQLIHFTHAGNLASILDHDLRSVAECEVSKISANRNDTLRLDGRSTGISVSITFPNHRMFYKYRKLSPGKDWAILLIDPSVLWKKDCAFCPNNAADRRIIHRSLEELKSVVSFREMFQRTAEIESYPLLPCDPTDEQAEILVFGRIEHHFIRSIAFEDWSTLNEYGRKLSPSLSFPLEQRRNLFGARSRYRKG